MTIDSLARDLIIRVQHAKAFPGFNRVKLTSAALQLGRACQGQDDDLAQLADRLA